MPRIPSQLTPYNISDTVAERKFDENGRETFRAYGSDYSERSGNTLFIGSAPLERFIAFKGFFDSIKINLEKETSIENLATRNFQIIKEITGKMYIDIEIKLPAHSTNEARNNLAKIEELQRLIMPAKWSADGSQLEYAFTGVASGPKDSRTTIPLFHVYFKNIINSGRDNRPRNIGDYDELIMHGMPCFIDTVAYEPDVSVGYFEFDNYLFPKLINLKLRLNYDSENLFDETRDHLTNKTILPFQLDGHFSQFDSTLFPFGIKVTFDQSEGPAKSAPVYEPAFAGKGGMDFTISQMNDLGYHSTFIFISLPINPTNTFPHRYVIFKPFLENFTRNVKTKVELAHHANSTINTRVLQRGVTPDMTEYSFKINIPSASLLEAKKNCGKIQYILRMFLKKYSDGFETIDQARSDLRFEDVKSKLLVYIPSMLEMPNSGPPSNDLADMYMNSVPLYLNALNFDIDMDAGFFEQGNNLYPKAMSLDFKFIYNRADMIRNYNLNESNKEDYYFFKPKESSRKPIIDSAAAHLFPFDRKTSKI